MLSKPTVQQCTTNCASKRCTARLMPLNCCAEPFSNHTTAFKPFLWFGDMLTKAGMAGASAAVVALLQLPPAQAMAEVYQLTEAGRQVALMELPPMPTQFPALPELTKLQYQEFTLPNGLQVVLVEDHEVPLVRGSLLMMGGQRASPADKVGLATIATAVQRSGGTTALPADLLDIALEAKGASIETSAGQETSSLSFECLAEDVQEVMQLAAEVLTTPRLPEDKLQLYTSQVLNALEHENDDPSGIPRRELAKLLYGKDSVYARSATQQQVRSIRRDDLADYLKQWQRPDTSILGITGDFDAGAMRQLVESSFGGWQAASGPPRSLPSTPIPPSITANTDVPIVYLIDRPGLPQAAVAMGEIGISVKDSDLFPLSVLNSILNSFGGKLFDEVRSQQGLAYSVSGAWSSTPTDHPGLFVAGGETAAAGQFIAAVKDVLDRVTREPPTLDDVTDAQQQTLNSFVFNFATPGQQLGRLMTYRLLGLPEDFIFQYKKGVEEVTPEQILAAAQRHLHPRQQVVVVVGDAQTVRPLLQELRCRIIPLNLEQGGSA